MTELTDAAKTVLDQVHTAVVAGVAPDGLKLVWEQYRKTLASPSSEIGYVLLTHGSEWPNPANGSTVYNLAGRWGNHVPGTDVWEVRVTFVRKVAP